MALAALLAVVSALTMTATAYAVVDGDVVEGGWQADVRPAVNPYGFVGRLDISGRSCSASLIAPDLALTAGHCASAVGGTITFDQLNVDRDNGVTRTVVKEHDLGDMWLEGASILMVWFDQPITTVEPVRLATPDDKDLWSGSKTLTSLGWGSITDSCAVGGPPFIATAELRRAEVKIVDTAVSFGIYRNAAKVAEVHGHPTHGDSGGPLVAQDAQGKFVQVGVYEATVGVCGREYAHYYNRLWTQGSLRDYLDENY